MYEVGQQVGSIGEEREPNGEKGDADQAPTILSQTADGGATGQQGNPCEQQVPREEDVDGAPALKKSAQKHGHREHRAEEQRRGRAREPPAQRFGNHEIGDTAQRWTRGGRPKERWRRNCGYFVARSEVAPRRHGTFRVLLAALALTACGKSRPCPRPRSTVRRCQSFNRTSISISNC